MSFAIKIALATVFLGIVYLGEVQVQAIPLGDRSAESNTEIAIIETDNASSPATTAIDTLGESNTRVKRQGGGCGCGCGCCCCRPRCCCCCTRCCTCCCTRCCTCCRPCCCGCGGGCGGGCGCGCCGCGGGGRKRRSLQQLQIKLADKIEKENNIPTPVEVAPVEETAVEIVVPEEESATEWPAPVFELVTETYA